MVLYVLARKIFVDVQINRSLIVFLNDVNTFLCRRLYKITASIKETPGWNYGEYNNL